MPYVDFIFNEIPTEIEKIIKEAKKELFLVSPFIDLSPNIRDILSLRKDDTDLFIRILFGKNENNLLRSFKKDSLAFLQEFPNIEIKYNERLHAKYYMNDWYCMVTSMNLYNYSLDKNIECGVLYQYNSRSVLGKSVDKINEGVYTAASKVIGEKEEVDPIDRMNEIYENSSLLYKTEPVFKEKKGFLSGLKKDELEGKNILVNKFEKEVPEKVEIKHVETSQNQPIKQKPTGKKVSLSKVSKTIQVDVETLKENLEDEGLIKQGDITKSGADLGLEMKNYMGNDYIAYPEDLYVFKVKIN